MVIDVVATCLALRIGSTKLQPLLKEMKKTAQ
jgi:RpiR family carbohydrate utilization transcriptional regulator